MIIGLTGKSCSGKDYFASLLDKNLFYVIDEDEFGHVALTEEKERLVEAFGDGILTDGKVDRRKLSPIVFSSPDKLDTLNGIVHPWMVNRTLELCKIGEDEGKIAVINAAILEKMGFVQYCDLVVLVLSSYENRLKRALLRDGCTEEMFKKRSDAQQEIGTTLFSSGKRLITIFNDGDKEALEKQVGFFTESMCKSSKKTH